MRSMFTIGGVALLGLALALTPAAAKGPVNASGKKGKNATTSDALTALEQAKVLLETAVHDYDGHRARAVGEIHHAIRALVPHHNNKATAAAKGTKAAGVGAGAGANALGENQAQSDTKLKQALLILNGLGEVPNAKATVHLQTAIAELNIALKIK